MGRYGNIGRSVPLYDAFTSWQQQMELEEAHTKADFADFLFGPVSTSLYKGYSKIMGQYRRYARVENLSDFNPRRIKGLRGITGMGYVGDGGEYPEATRGERPNASLLIDTYGTTYSITRQAVINDSTKELLKSNPEELGQLAALFIVETFIAYIESNPTAPDGNPVYDNSRGNTVTAALSEDSLATAISTMESQLDEDGRHISLNVRTLAVKNARMELIANRIINSQLTGSTVNWTGASGVGSNVMDKGTMNPLKGILPSDAVVKDPYWTDANDWYLFADPEDVPAFAAGFLNGNEKPQVFLKNPEAAVVGGSGNDPYTWEWDSVDYKVRTDFGISTVDPVGTYRSIVT